ncbi:ROK family protein [Leucobacter allii]|uniref:ROK family protein n=1 Tax=Leucobacter allii TaxID=2932247 RepID=UPI001FD1F578|nr:ROK family protein [Leucobacter allii]UOR03246.1 ROK family protein [Leucobacter allii]
MADGELGTTVNQHQRSNEQVRRGNLATVLRALHYDGPQSRAELTRRTGLYRSTIAALVAELGELGLVSEALPAKRSGVGRPSPIVAVNPDVVAVTAYPDIDAVVIAVVGLGGVVHKRVRTTSATRPGPEEAANIIAAVLAGMRDELNARTRVVGVGAAVPALVDAAAGVIALAPNLSWQDVPFAAMLEERIGYRTVVANDAQLGAAAERQFGPGRGVDHLLYLNGSGGGIGGGAYVDGQELRGFRGFGGEFGHIVLDPDGEPCFCGQRGCFERVVQRGALLRVLGAESLDADELERAVAESSDPAVHREIDRQVDRLGDGIGILISVLAPELVVLGGFLATLYEARAERLERRIADRSFGRLSAGVRIVTGGLRTHEVLLGAAERVFEELLDDPAG